MWERRRNRSWNDLATGNVRSWRHPNRHPSVAQWIEYVNVSSTSPVGFVRLSNPGSVNVPRSVHDQNRSFVDRLVCDNRERRGDVVDRDRERSVSCHRHHRRPSRSTCTCRCRHRCANIKRTAVTSAARREHRSWHTRMTPVPSPSLIEYVNVPRPSRLLSGLSKPGSVNVPRIRQTEDCALANRLVRANGQGRATLFDRTDVVAANTHIVIHDLMVTVYGAVVA